MSDQAIRVQAQERECFPPVGSAHESLIRGCLKIESGPAAVDFGGGQGGEACASPQRAVKVEPTPANAKRRVEGPLSIFRQARSAPERFETLLHLKGFAGGVPLNTETTAVKPRVGIL